MSETGNLFVIAAPSGAGKTTLVQALVESTPQITVSISHTTRPKRPLEISGINYYFIDTNQFIQQIEENDFLEYATIFNHYYGTSKKWVKETLDAGMDVILEIDWQGHQQVKKIFPHAVGIFILPPSLDDLKKRLDSRNQDHQTIIATRLQDAKLTVSHISDFDYVVINDNFERALNDLKVIINSERLRLSRQLQKYEHLINDLKETNF